MQTRELEMCWEWGRRERIRVRVWSEREVKGSGAEEGDSSGSEGGVSERDDFRIFRTTWGMAWSRTQSSDQLSRRFDGDEDI